MNDGDWASGGREVNADDGDDISATSRLPLGYPSATSRLPLGYVSAISDVVKEGDVDATRSHVRHHEHPSLALIINQRTDQLRISFRHREHPSRACAELAEGDLARGGVERALVNQ